MPTTTHTETPTLKVRSAVESDINELVRLELETFSDVYGDEPSSEAVKSVRQKYTERVELLGSWFTVLADENDNLSGMLVCCTTSNDDEYFLGNGEEHDDMTTAGAVETIYDADGKNLYIVNLAVSHTNQATAASSLQLILDGMQRAEDEGLKKAYFTSRLPLFMEWLGENGYDGLDMNDTKAVTLLANDYIRATREDGKLYDPLLNLYVNGYGAHVIRAIPEAWIIDYPSKAFGAVGVYYVDKSAREAHMGAE
ncbi:MAG: hypothetical protein H6799_03545 [Candidatus Nomurabacteria bacterium]|nr:MAG: hypothetical protein H6799_03545 [Candidatus Nomurabacteria bacterium]